MEHNRGAAIMMNARRHAPIIHVLLLGCLMALSACAAVPVQERRGLSERLPEQFIETGLAIEHTRVFWDRSFPSERLRADVLALPEGNFELEAARARIEQTAAAHGLTEAELLPSLNLGTDIERSRVKEVEEDAESTTLNLFTFNTALQWEADIWGRLRNREKAASLSYEEKQALADQTRLKLQALLVENWVIHHGARKLERILAEQRETNTQYLDLTELRLIQGQGNGLDVLQQRGRLAATGRALPPVISTKRQAANAYAVLTGRFPERGDLPEDDWPGLEPLPALPSPRELLIGRPDLRAAFLALRAADHHVAAAVAERLPRLSVGLSYGESVDLLATMGKGTALRLTSGLLAPVFDAGRLEAQKAQREAEARERLALLEQAMLEAVRQVEDALIRERTLFDEQNTLCAEISIAHDRVEKARLRYLNGQESYLAVLAALEGLQALQVKEITLRQDLLINRCRLLKALGANWSQDDEIYQ